MKYYLYLSRARQGKIGGFMGTIYKRGDIWWIKYYRNGKGFRESTKSSKKMVAKRLLDRREGEIANGKLPSILFEKVTFDELAEDFLRDYRINQKKSLVRAERSVGHLNRFFGEMRVVEITTPKINIYIEQRINEKAKNATINRELAALKRMMNIGAKQTPPRVDRVPYISMLKENNTRKGFFEHDEFLALLENLPFYLKPVLVFAYKTGWRFEEILSLPWNQVDRHNKCARLESGDTKNDDARTFYFDNEIAEIFDRLWRKRKQQPNFCKYVFLNAKGSDRIYRFDKAWQTACDNAGVSGRIFHDLRRTAVRNMVRAGVPEAIVMKISGHKTRSVFDRYNIVSDADLKNAVRLQEEYLAKQKKFVMGTI